MNASIKEQIINDGYIVYKIQGKSMEPMLIPDRDIVTISSISDHQLRENDVVLYTKGDKLILHRIIHIDGDNILILGDNCHKIENDISRGDIIGVMTSFIHNKTHYSAYDKNYLEYVVRMRACEHSRRRKKYIIDAISYYMSFLPDEKMIVLKQFLKKMLHYNYYF